MCKVSRFCCVIALLSIFSWSAESIWHLIHCRMNEMSLDPFYSLNLQFWIFLSFSCVRICIKVSDVTRNEKSGRSLGTCFYTKFWCLKLKFMDQSSMERQSWPLRLHVSSSVMSGCPAAAGVMVTWWHGWQAGSHAIRSLLSTAPHQARGAQYCPLRFLNLTSILWWTEEYTIYEEEIGGIQMLWLFTIAWKQYQYPFLNIAYL